MTTNKHNEECCEKCRKLGRYLGEFENCDDDCPCHTKPATDEDIDKAVSLLPNPEDDGPNAAGNQIPTVPHGVISTDMVVTPKSKYDDPNFKSDFDKFVEEHPITDVSWEEEFDKRFASEIDSGEYIKYAPAIKSFIRKQIDLAYDAGHAKRGGVESAQKQRMFEAGKGIGRREAIAEMREWAQANYKEYIHISANFGMHTKTDAVNLSDVLFYLEALSNK